MEIDDGRASREHMRYGDVPRLKTTRRRTLHQIRSITNASLICSGLQADASADLLLYLEQMKAYMVRGKRGAYLAS